MNWKKIKINILLIIIILNCFVWAQSAQAGFGISPPYVKTIKPIFPGSHFEQSITLLRSSAEEEMEAIIKINAPEIADWITIVQGDVFDLPKDQLRVPMVVMVDVPNKAEIGNYQGYINIQIAPKGKNQGGGVTIALGARVDIDLNITNETFLDFTVRKFGIPDFEMLKEPWSWKIFSMFFYRVKAAITIKNTGNVKVAPTKVSLEVYDLTKTILFESSLDKKIKKVEPFKTETVYASFPTKLEAGQYWGKIRVYKDDAIVYKDETIFSVKPPGGLEDGTKLGIWPWIMLSGIIVFIVLIIFILIKIKIWLYIYRVIYIISWPLRMIFWKIVFCWKKIKQAFWGKMHQKAEKYKKESIDDKESGNEE